MMLPEPFDAPQGEELLVDLDGFEGPISLLLSLAREQKVDLKQISILALADQYLAFIARAEALRLDMAADYLVTAAWLAYLKSRLLLPDPPPDDEPSGAELAAALQFRLQRLEAMQAAGVVLLRRPLLGRDVFPRGAPEGLAAAPPLYAVTLHELLTAYAATCRSDTATSLRIKPAEYYTVEAALKRLASLIGTNVEWRVLQAFLPPFFAEGVLARSALAATFVAGLELAKAGTIELRQDEPFGTIFLRAARPSR
jgi:segregation and condensation protein A